MTRLTPWPFRAEDCLEELHTTSQRVSLLSPAQLRQGHNLRTLIEARDYIEAALGNARSERGE